MEEAISFEKLCRFCFSIPFSTLWVLIGQRQSKEVPSVLEYLTVVWEEKVRWAGGSETCKGMSPHKTPYVTVLITLFYYLV